jgi:hypothetical protein
MGLDPPQTCDFAGIIRNGPIASRLLHADSRLVIERTEWRGRNIEVCYSPFEHVEATARIVIVGLTPGRQQAERAIDSFASALRRGATTEAALQEAKSRASFAGPMRRNLVRMLDLLGVASLVGVHSCEDLWEDGAKLAHFTSLIRYPVFVDGANWSGSPDPVRHPVLRRWMEAWTGRELRSLKPAILVPLGSAAIRGLDHLVAAGAVDEERILRGLPHPSGANAERIACFMGDKPAHLASTKTDGHGLAEAREHMREQVAALASLAQP